MTPGWTGNRAALRQLRVGFVTGAYVTGGEPPRTYDALGKLIGELHRRSKSIDLAISMVENPRDFCTYPLPIDSDTFRLQPLPEMLSFGSGFRKGRECRRIIRRLEDRCDALIVQLPFSPPQALFRARKPRLYQVCADCVEVVRASRFYRGIKRCAAVTAAHAVDHVQQHLLRRADTRVVTNGTALYRHYGSPPGQPIISASLFDAEIDSVRRSRPIDAPPRILFVGYLRPEKGIDTLLDAFHRVRVILPTAELQIVGSQDLVEAGACRELHSAIGDLRDAGVLRLEGFIPLGPKLFQVYADADILVLPSRSEGTPRVLNEARSFRCPVVATRVGGIPDSVEHDVDGLLIPPDDPAALAGEIVRLMSDRALRRRLSDTGLERMRGRSIERFVDILEHELEQIVSQ